MKLKIVFILLGIYFLSPCLAMAQTITPLVPIANGQVSASKINLNTASKEQLMSLPGIGEKRAQAIMDRRKAKPYRKVNDLISIKGIGPKQMAKLKPLVSI